MPLIVIIVIGYPLFIMMKMRQQKSFNDVSFIRRYGVFFIGLKDKMYFWEVLVSNARKIISIIFISVIP